MRRIRIFTNFDYSASDLRVDLFRHVQILIRLPDAYYNSHTPTYDILNMVYTVYHHIWKHKVGTRRLSALKAN